MWIKRSSIQKLSTDVKRLIAGDEIDIRDNREGPLRILKNDIQTLATYQKEYVEILEQERDVLKEMLANVSHQLKTPLTSMMIMTELIEDAPPEKQVEFISNIQSSLRRTEWLVSALLKMAKLDAKAVEFKQARIDSNQLIEAALSPLKIQLELKEQAIKITGSQTFNCDKRWTAEALGNVIKNASEHAPTGSIIQVEVGENPICKWIRVRDEGKGLDRAQIAKLFKRFEGSEHIQGYGIGLPLALTIMKSQFGDIDVDGGKGRGSTFTLKFYNGMKDD
ncbi:MAG: HAMP domain-containing histidine kinase [Defluviitaleaceae bacterium]|nr:HAMP domain-containing histidine kinase [Defluviitaleaceae bacterium]